MNTSLQQLLRKRRLKVNLKNRDLKNKKMLISKKILIAYRISTRRKMPTKISFMKNQLRLLKKILNQLKLMRRKLIRRMLDRTQNISWIKNLKRKRRKLRRNQLLLTKINRTFTSKFGRNLIQKTQKE